MAIEPGLPCSAKITPRGQNFPRSRPCKLQATCEVGGSYYCEYHNPNKAKEKEQAKQKAFDEQQIKDKYKFDCAVACKGMIHPVQEMKELRSNHNLLL